jgi:hypothetical protein
MTKTTTEHNVETGEIIEREPTAEEIANIAKMQAKRKVIEDAEAQAQADKAALLAKLGITADEAKLLLS